jgi:hypothetical protein
LFFTEGCFLVIGGRIYVSPGGFIVVGFVVFTSTTEAAAPHF